MCITLRQVESTLKLKNDTKAIFSEDNQWKVVVIPASAQVTLVEGDMEQDRFVKIRYQGKVVLILSEDLRRGIGLVPDQSRH
jgi:hypothetical protein